MKTVMIAGKWDPVHDGHIEHIWAASKLGDYLYIVAHPDEVIKQMKNGKCEIPYWAKLVLLNGIMKHYGIEGSVICSIDNDGLVAETLRMIRPDVFAKGGPYNPNNLPTPEIKACDEIGCKIAYGVGGYGKINNSSQMDIVRSSVSNTL